MIWIEFRGEAAPIFKRARDDCALGMCVERVVVSKRIDRGWKGNT
jgi:hypothetical protein